MPDAETVATDTSVELHVTVRPLIGPRHHAVAVKLASAPTSIAMADGDTETDATVATEERMRVPAAGARQCSGHADQTESVLYRMRTFPASGCPPGRRTASGYSR
jgi:hypothetical protein